MMGLRHRDLDGPKFQMREKILAIGDDFWIEDDNGHKVYKVNGKAARLRETFILEDPNGNELSKIQEKKLTVRDKMTIERGEVKATVHKRLIGIRDHYIIKIDGGDELKAHGNIVDHEYEIERDGDKVATFLAGFVSYLTENTLLLRLDAIVQGLLESDVDAAGVAAFKDALHSRMAAEAARLALAQVEKRVMALPMPKPPELQSLPRQEPGVRLRRE